MKPQGQGIYTDGSLNSTNHTATAAYFVSEMNLRWKKLSNEATSSTAAELAAIAAALTQISKLPPCSAVTYTDSRATLRRLKRRCKANNGNPKECNLSDYARMEPGFATGACAFRDIWQRERRYFSRILTRASTATRLAQPRKKGYILTPPCPI